MKKVKLTAEQVSRLKHLIAYRLRYWQNLYDQESDLEKKLDMEDSIEVLNSLLEVLK